MQMTQQNPSLESLYEKHLGCPKCHARSLAIENAGYRCLNCPQAGVIRDGVFLARPLKDGHYFDELHGVMQAGNEEADIWSMCYEQQSRLAAELIKAGDVVLDVGCGPKIHFERPKDCVLMGIDPSFESIRSNKSLDIRIFGAAEALPLPDDSVDRMFFFYSIHHMIGQTVDENFANVEAALREAGRVVRDGGDVMMFDMSPWWPAWHAQKLAWNQARKVLAGKLDMFFWRESALRSLARGVFSEKKFETRAFSVSPFFVFPPVFSLPQFRLPRFMYPFDIMMYRWSF
jgi:ubiquinone/menaquinone biosynthesis C-methylase UbiE